MSDDHSLELLSRFARLISADRGDGELQPVHWLALGFLNRANRYSRTPKGLTAWLDQTKGSVSQTIAVLEKKGLVSRHSDPADKRVVRLDLTAAGQRMIALGMTPVAEQMLSYLPKNERAQFIQMVERMIKNQISRMQGRQFGLCKDCRNFIRGDSGNHCQLLGVPLQGFESEQICIEQDAA